MTRSPGDRLDPTSGAHAVDGQDHLADLSGGCLRCWRSTGLRHSRRVIRPAQSLDLLRKHREQHGGFVIRGQALCGAGRAERLKPGLEQASRASGDRRNSCLRGNPREVGVTNGIQPIAPRTTGISRTTSSKSRSCLARRVGCGSSRACVRYQAGLCRWRTGWSRSPPRRLRH